MLKTKDVEIDENLIVTLKALPATDASDVMYRLTAALGPAATALTQALEGEQLDLKVLPEAVRLLFQHLPAKEFRELREMLFRESTFLQSETSEQKAATGALLGKMTGAVKLTNFDVLFAGRLGKMFPLLWEALALNFGFSDAASLDVVKDRVKAAVSKFMSKANSKNVGLVTDSSSSG